MIMMKIILIVFVACLFFGFEYALCASLKGSKGNCVYEPDFLIILGYRVEEDKADEILLMRIDAAAKYLKKHKRTFAIPTGGITHSGQIKSEADIIVEELVKRGIDKDRILIENQAKTTEQNFVYSKKIIDSIDMENTPKIAFLSSDFHLYRSGLLAKKCGVTALSIPAESPEKLKVKNYLREAVIILFMYITSFGGKKNG